MMRTWARMRFLPERKRLEYFPPFWLMRIRVVHLDEQWRHVHIRLPLTWVSANAKGNMFGGFQACLADPIPALACLKLLPGYRVATQKLELDFVRVGNSDLLLEFDVSDQQLHEIRCEVAETGRATPCFDMRYRRVDGQVCTYIRNTVAIRSISR